MKKILIALALGTAAGLAVSEIPQVRQMLDKGKEKAKKMTK